MTQVYVDIFKFLESVANVFTKRDGSEFLPCLRYDGEKLIV
jgi:hypothetical protein